MIHIVRIRGMWNASDIFSRLSLHIIDKTLGGGSIYMLSLVFHPLYGQKPLPRSHLFRRRPLHKDQTGISIRHRQSRLPHTSFTENFLGMVIRDQGPEHRSRYPCSRRHPWARPPESQAEAFTLSRRRRRIRAVVRLPSLWYPHRYGKHSAAACRLHHGREWPVGKNAQSSAHRRASRRP